MSRLPSQTFLTLLLLAVALPQSGRAQEVESPEARKTSLGLSSVGAFTLHAGGALIERDATGAEAGASLDLGHFSSTRFRLVVDLSFLRSWPYSERVETEGKSYRDVFYDLAGHVMAAFHLASNQARFNPYVAGGLGIHALTSSFGSLTIDGRYNTNNFGLVGAAGARVRVGKGARRGLLLEIRRIQSKDVSRVTAQVGISALFNDLARR